MKFSSVIKIMTLATLVACSTASKVSTDKVSFQNASRTIAATESEGKALKVRQVRKTLKGIFHSYLLGQTLLEEFDAALDKDASTAMDTQTYSQLMAVRDMVDFFEESINEMYIKLTLVSASHDTSPEQKEKALRSIDAINRFMEGMIDDNKEMPENLKYLILGNLKEKQSKLADDLTAMKSEIHDYEHNPTVIDEHISKLKKPNSIFKKIKNYIVDRKILRDAVSEVENDEDFREFKANVKKMSKEMRKYNREIKRGRTTSSDVIFPSSGTAGNISGRGFPENTWSLTFDDGPGSKTTPQVVKNLTDKGLKATFFMLAQQIEALPNAAKAVKDAGMEIASHSYDHKQLLASTPDSVLEKQIGTAKRVIEEKLGVEVKLFRLPYGAGTGVSAIRSKIAKYNMVHVFWNVDTLDWQDKNPNSIVQRAIKQMQASAKNSGVVLFHDVHTQSVTASALLMDHMKSKGIKVCTVQKVIDQMNKGLKSCQ